MKKSHVSPKKNITVSNFLARYMLLYPNCAISKRKKFSVLFNSKFGTRKMSTISSAEIEVWLWNTVLDGDYSMKTARQFKSCLSQMFDFACKEEVIAANIVGSIKVTGRHTSRRPRIILSENDLCRILKVIRVTEAIEIYSFFYTLAHTGARRNEVLELAWKDINLDAKLITLVKTKNGSNRTIRMNEALSLQLQQIKSERERVFSTTNGDKLTRSILFRFFQRIRKGFPELPQFACHDLRHSFAHNYLLKGGNMYSLKAILGHKSISMTIDLYGNYQSVLVGFSSPYNF